MKLIRPVTINDAALVSASIPETDYSAWSSGTTYAVGNRVIKTSTHRIYESLQASNTNHDPETSPTWWLDIGPTNRWSMFDGVVGTSSSASTSISVTLHPGRIDSIALLDVDAQTVTVTMVNGVETVYSKTITMTDESMIVDWYSYFFEPIKSKDFLVLTDLPVYGGADVTITLSKTSGTVSCGVCVVGLQASLGDTLSSPTISINDYSRKTVDDFGNTLLVQRSFAKKASVKMVVDNSEIDRIASILSDVRAIPVVWVGSDKFSSMTIYGFYRDFNIDIPYHNLSYCSLNIEGLI